jgi:predicted MFS family arabinose efflux permease
VVFVTVLLYGVAVAAWSVAGTFALLVVLAVVAGFLEGPTLTAVFAARQRYTPPALLAQVSTTGASLKIGAFALGSAAGGLLVPVLGPAAVIAVVGAGQVVAVALGRLAAREPAR